MATVSDFTKLNALVLQFAIADVPQTPSEVIQGAETDLVGFLERVVAASEIGQGWILFAADVRETINEVMSRWANAATPGKYATTGENDSTGWLVLSWAISEMIMADAKNVRVQ